MVFDGLLIVVEQCRALTKAGQFLNTALLVPPSSLFFVSIALKSAHVHTTFKRRPAWFIVDRRIQWRNASSDA